MPERPMRVGLVINPIAGMGGAVGLKGTDGDRARRARELGANPHAAQRARGALAELHSADADIVWHTAQGDMGEELLMAIGVSPAVVHPHSQPSDGEDTQTVVRTMGSADLDLLLFVGGDGTARDVLASAEESLPVLGIPAGVKMHSAVFGLTPRTAGNAARRFLEAGAPARFCEPGAVMDREFTASGEPASSPTLHGYLSTLQMPSLVQAAKSSGVSSGAELTGALHKVRDDLHDFEVAILGPGATMYALKQALGFAGTLLGVDVYRDGLCSIRDAREDQIWEAMQGKKICLVVGVIGGQGFLFGRGNQQLSARVLREIPREHLRIVASAQKLAALPASALHVDTGDESVDSALSGYLPVITGLRRSTLCPILAST